MTKSYMYISYEKSAVMYYINWFFFLDALYMYIVCKQKYIIIIVWSLKTSRSFKVCIISHIIIPPTFKHCI